MIFTDPTHIRFVKKVKRFCDKHGIDLEFGFKLVSPLYGDGIAGFFTQPTDKNHAKIQVVMRFGHDIAIYALAHELCHAKRCLKDPIKFKMRSKDFVLCNKEEILTQRMTMRMLRKEKVEVNFEEVESAIKDSIAFHRENIALFGRVEKEYERAAKIMGI